MCVAKAATSEIGSWVSKMGSQARERDAMVAREIHDAGGRITERGVDGAGHCVVYYEIAGRIGKFHYAKTSANSGCRLLNIRRSLRQDIAAIKSLPPLVPDEKIPEVVVRESLVIERPPPTPPKPKLARKEMIKSYLTMGSLAEFMETYDLERTPAQNMLLSSRGQAADKLRRELNNERAAAAKQVRHSLPTKTGKIPTAVEREEIKRDNRIATYCKFGVTTEEAADMFNLSKSYVERIIRTQNEEV